MQAKWVQSKYGAGATLYLVHNGKPLRYVGAGYHWDKDGYRITFCGETLPHQLKDVNDAKRRCEEALKSLCQQVLGALASLEQK